MEETLQTSPEQVAPENPVIITANRSLSGVRLKNFYITNAFQWFVWMIFHFSMVFFFTFQLQNVFLVGIFLGIANFIAFLIDIPIGILQRYFSTKKFFMIWAVSQLIATAIFFNFIHSIFSNVGVIGNMVAPEWFHSVIWWFFGDAINWILILIASFCYGLTKEMNDISTFGYILSNAGPSEYSIILARNNITYWVGSLVGLLLSWVILNFAPTIAIILLAVIIVAFLLFTSRFFDNDKDSIEVADIVSFTVAVKRLNQENIREYISEKINIHDLPKIVENAKYIFFKPRRQELSTFDKKIFIQECKKNIITIWTILWHMPIYIIIYWTITLVLIFWFWDTFASTFLISFLDSIKEGWWYILLAGIAIPALGLQEICAKLAQKVGVKTVAFFWLWLSGISLIGMGIFDANANPLTIIIFALVNSIGYACGMSLGQNGFLEAYNKIYASSNWLSEIDANAAAWPMKILQNLANVVGLVLGWVILWIFGYTGFFILFGTIILAALGWSIMKRNIIEI